MFKSFLIKRTGTLIGVSVLFSLLFSACGSSDAETQRYPGGKSSFQAHVRAISNSAVNFNDLSGRHPNKEAFEGYAEVLNNQLNDLKNDHPDDVSKHEGLSDQLDSLAVYINILRSNNADARLAAHKRIFSLQKNWIKDFNLE